jgi:UDP-N-acetylglucosamine 4,6-dehydratase
LREGPAAGGHFLQPSSMPSLDYVRDRTVLVTGAAGTIGAALVERLLPVARTVRCLDHGETELFFLHQRLERRGRLAPQLGDIRDLDRLRFAMSGVDVVFHAAALKHVGLGEYNPFEVVQTNLQGSNNVVRAALDANVDRVIFTSSDKAVNPTNVMGASKLMGERLVIAANQIRGQRRTRFSAVRFGNVIGSRGSVVPIFAGQLLRREPLTITHETMTRYVMTVDDAAQLVLEAGALLHGGEIFVTKMRALRVVDLADAMAQLMTSGQYEKVTTGQRAGEKLYEELISTEEIERTVELERLLDVLPVEAADGEGAELRAAYAEGKPVGREWNSANDTAMTRPEIVAFLKKHRVLEPFLAPRAVSEGAA